MRIGTLKYLEIKIEEWQSRANWGQVGSNGAKKGQKVAYGAKRGQMGSYGADFLHDEIKKSCLATHALRQKFAKLWGFC